MRSKISRLSVMLLENMCDSDSCYQNLLDPI